jgi:hypothetical protein
MTNPINPGVGAPVSRTTTTEPRPKTNSSDAKFTVPDTGDSVTARGNLSFGSLTSLVNTELGRDAAKATAQQVEKLLEKETLPLVNNRPQVVSSLMDSLLQEQEQQQK